MWFLVLGKYPRFLTPPSLFLVLGKEVPTVHKKKVFFFQKFEIIIIIKLYHRRGTTGPIRVWELKFPRRDELDSFVTLMSTLSRTLGVHKSSPLYLSRVDRCS